MKGATPKKKVILKALPAGFVDDLPLEDQRAILAAIGKRVRFKGYDTDGRAELEFGEKRRDTTHTIWIDPRFIEPC